MKRKILICTNLVVIALFVMVANLDNKKYATLDEKDYAKVFNQELTGNLTNQVNFIEDIAQNDNREIRSWGIRRNKDHKTPFADNGVDDLLPKYNSYYLGDITKKKIYLTFDEGYENGYTGNILDTLKAKGVKAVFFITGPYLKDHKELVERMVKEGHSVGNHTVNHPSLPQISDDKVKSELRDLDYKFYEDFNEHMKFFRAPKGEYSERTLKITNEMGYINLFWSLAYDDWYRDKVRGYEYAHKIVTDNLHNGAIILLHAVSKDNAEALPYIIDTARELGFEFGDCKEDFTK